VTRIAHLSDVHILDPRTRRSTARYRFAAKLVSLGRAVDPRIRARKLARALRAAKAAGADHIVISGDLTELGDATEFEHFASVLEEQGLDGDSVTLVPGNHDAYTTASGWRNALEGPLRRFASTSASEPGKLVDRGPVALLPIDTTCFQSVVRAGGVFTADAARAIESRLVDPALRDKAIVLVLHHSPFVQHKTPVMQLFDGLRGYARVTDLLVRHPRLQVLHGHLHRLVDKMMTVTGTTRARVFGAPAVCDDPGDDPDADAVPPPRVRLYDVRDGALAPAGPSL
jgi:3',5'-cyclic AMP phosphodiesterase CpdA